jgi:hypothetical protein
MLRLLGLDLLSNSQLWLLIFAGGGLSVVIGWIFDFIMGRTGLGVIGNTFVVILSTIIAFGLYSLGFGRPRIEAAPLILATLCASIVAGMFLATTLKRRAFG